jgi:hypothetical protein
MDHPRIRRLLRIALSVVCGIGCLLLIALWVRSYKHDTVYCSCPARRLARTAESFGDVATDRNWNRHQECLWCGRIESDYHCLRAGHNSMRTGIFQRGWT